MDIYKSARRAVAKHVNKATRILAQIESLKEKLEESASECTEAIGEASENLVYGDSDEKWELDQTELDDWAKDILKDIDENEEIEAEADTYG